MKDRLYDDNLYQFHKPQASYWEATADDIKVSAPALSGDETCDVAVIGGGYTGLSAAYHLARNHNVDVRVLEAGHFGWGASGRNGGFCCIGGVGVHRRDLIRMVGVDRARQYYQSQIDAVELVRRIGEEERLDFRAQGSAELEVAHTKKAFERLREDFDVSSRHLNLPVELLSAEQFRERHFDSDEQFGALVSRPAFGLHPLRYCRGFANAALRHGAVLHERSEVLDWSKGDDGWHRINTAGGSLRARKVIFSTNGFMPERLKPEFYARTMPIISAIIVTSPLTELQKAAYNWVTADTAANSRRVLNYFRLLPDNRFLFGGRGHSSGHPDGEQETYARLESMLKSIWPKWADLAVDYKWHGLICMAGSMCPSIGQLDDDKSVSFAYGYHGNGVNTATWAGKKLADWIGSGQVPDMPDIVQGMAKKFPLASLRLKYFRLAIGLASWMDRRG